MYPDSDLTGYLAAVSLGRDGNLDYTRADSDRYFREYGARPAPFRILQKKIIDSTGQFKSYYVFHAPDLFVFILAPFVALLHFRGWFLLHSLLVLGIYLL